MNSYKEWIVRATAEQLQNSDLAQQIARELKLALPTAQLLINRGCTNQEEAFNFLAKNTEMFHDPFAMTDMKKAAEALITAVEEEKKIVIYGDYDVDGVTSVSSLYLYLSKLGADVGYYIPCRLGEGYGMSEASLKKLADDGVQTIITVDTGVTAIREAKLAKELGITLIVTDHHECCGELPDAVAVVDPHRPDDTYPFKELAGVGVVFKLLCAMESLLNPEDLLGECVRRICMAYMDLVAIGTVADVMPLCDENRLIVALGIRMIEDSPREGIRALLDAAQSESKGGGRKKITSSLIGFTVAPRINAAGRIQDASMAVKLFLEDDSETANRLAYKLCDINRQRQSEENKIVDAAYARIDAKHDPAKDPVIILEDEKWHHGVIGIVCSRITEKYNCPSILISFAPQTAESPAFPNPASPDDLGKGSGRSVKGLNLVEALSACSDLLEKFGGHELAAGLTIRREMLPAFKEKLNEYARACFKEGIPLPSIEADCELTPDNITMEQAEQLYALEPFGVSNPTPLFVTTSMTLTDLIPVSAGKHLKLRLEKSGVSVTAMYFRHGLSDIDFYPGERVDVLYNLDINEFQGNQTLQMIVKDIRLAEDIFLREEEERVQYNDVFACMMEDRPLDAKSIPFVVPDRNDFAAVFTTIRKEVSLGHEIYSIRALRHLLRSSRIHIGYTKLNIIIAVFSELNLLRVDELDTEREVYRFRMIYGREKTSLERSALLRKLRACAAASR